MNKKYIQIYFTSGISAGEWGNITSLFSNVLHKNIGILINKMNDTAYKEIQLTASLSKDNDAFLRGLILGYTRVEPYYTYVNQYGEKNE